MGYTEVDSTNMIGLGVSAISDMWTSFAQNEKGVEQYYERIDQGQHTVVKGHHLSKEDQIIRQHLLNITCLLFSSKSTCCPVCNAAVTMISAIE